MTTTKTPKIETPKSGMWTALERLQRATAILEQSITGLRSMNLGPWADRVASLTEKLDVIHEEAGNAVCEAEARTGLEG